MNGSGSVFFEFNLPNAATWFYFSLLLAVALFFRFTRALSVRNWDILTLFLLVPGLLLLQEAHTQTSKIDQAPAVSAAQLLAGAGAALLASPGFGLGAASLAAAAAVPLASAPQRLLWFGYLWLFCGSAYFLVRCLIDLALVRRPALSPNLNLSGLAWLAGALFVCLVAVAVRRPEGSPGIVGKRSVAVNETQRRAEDLVKLEIGTDYVDEVSASFWVARILAIACHAAIVAGLIFIGYRHFQDATAGMAAATFYLLLPYTAYYVEQFHHAWPVALLVWAVAGYRRPVLAGLLLGIAAGTVYFPVFLFPAWLSFYWRRGAGRFALTFWLSAGACLAAIGTLLWLDGQLGRSVQSALSLSDWQPWRELHPETEGFWTGVRWVWAYRMPVFIAYQAFVVTTVFWPSPKNLAHILALSAGVLVGLQFWYADQGGVYVLWYLPLLLLIVFRPNLADRFPAAIHPEVDWLSRSRRAVHRLANRLVNPPAPAVRVH